MIYNIVIRKTLAFRQNRKRDRHKQLFKLVLKKDSDIFSWAMASCNTRTHTHIRTHTHTHIHTHAHARIHTNTCTCSSSSSSSSFFFFFFFSVRCFLCLFCGEGMTVHVQMWTKIYLKLSKNLETIKNRILVHGYKLRKHRFQIA